jgi:hypothetical protein
VTEVSHNQAATSLMGPVLALPLLMLQPDPQVQGASGGAATGGHGLQDDRTGD